MMDQSALVRELRRARAALVESVGGLPDDAFVRRPPGDEWSVLDVLRHIPDVDRHWLEQALAIHDDATHVFVHFDDERWKRENRDRGEVAPGAVLEMVNRTHETTVQQLLMLSAEDLDRPGRHPRGIPYTVRDVFLRFPAHDRNHAGQIAEIRARIGV